MEAETPVALYENETVYSKKLFQSVYANHFFTQPVMLIACFLALQPLSVALFSGLSSWMSLLPLAIALLLLPLMYTRGVNSVVSQELASGGGEWPRRQVKVFADHIHVQVSNGQEHEIPFSEIKSLRTTKTYLQINTRSKLIVILSRDGYTVGTQEECAHFLSIQKESLRSGGFAKQFDFFKD